MARKSFDHAVVFGLLKDAIRRLVVLGNSYRELCVHMEQSGAADRWNENSLKQFVHRDSPARDNQKHRDLLNFIVSYYDENYDSRNISDPELENIIQKIYEILQDKSLSAILNRISNKFLTIRNNSIRIHLPRMYYFIRVGEKQNKIYFIPIFTYRTKNGYFFEMKIKGVIKNRYVTGDVSITLSNIYFMGLGFGVRDGSSAVFDEIDPLDEKSLSSYVSDEPIGLEILSFPVASISETVFPVSLLGMDANGSPIHGRGMMINCDVNSDICDFLVPGSVDWILFSEKRENDHLISLIKKNILSSSSVLP